MKPHEFQVEASDSIFTYFATHAEGNPLVAMPTGTGKSIVIACFLQRIFQVYARQRVMCLTHVKELIQQNYEKLLQLWPGAPAGINSAGLGRRDTLSPIIFAGIKSVYKHGEHFGHVDLVLIDEAHLVSPDEEAMYQSFFAALRVRNPHVRVIGFTATPWRAGYGLMTEAGIFTDFCFNITYMQAFNWLIEQGYLCPLVPMRTKLELNIEGVHMRGADYIASELQDAVNKDEVTELAVQESIDAAGGRAHWLAFCAGVEHAIATAEILNANGVKAVAVHNRMGKQERDEAILGWKEGYYQAATNNNVLTTGIDFPGIDFIMMLRPTASTNYWVQMLGRGTRCLYAPGFDITEYLQRMESIRLGGKEDCLVHDYAGNTRRLGPINDPVLPRKKGEKTGDPPIRICDNCGMYNHASARKCASCDFEFPIGGMKLNHVASKDALIKTDDPPLVETFKVDHIAYSCHSKLGAPDSMKVQYQCGLRMFAEYVCFEHPGHAGKKAQRWWKEHGQKWIPPSPDAIGSMPNKVWEAIDRSTDLKAPTHIRVWTNKPKYPEIMSYVYDKVGLPSVQKAAKRDANPPNWEEDDIPF